VSYALLDSGAGRKLERVGPYLVERQAPVALWQPSLGASVWEGADAVHMRTDTGGGRWQTRTEVPERWEIELAGVKLYAKLTPFGHMGVFPEHAAHWGWLRAVAAQHGDPIEVLNLFAYTGAPSIACAEAGMRVTHVDAAQSIVDWGRENAALTAPGGAPIRWIVDDCAVFVRRELRRGRRYGGLILDPPSFGRGPKGNVFKIESDLVSLLDQCRELLDPRPAFVLLTCHTPGFTPIVLENLLAERFGASELRTESGEMTLTEEKTGRRLPAGAYCRLGPHPG
jgi:23S rRNA (cytosine1962-C5)-methyltransferase